MPKWIFQKTSRDQQEDRAGKCQNKHYVYLLETPQYIAFRFPQGIVYYKNSIKISHAKDISKNCWNFEYIKKRQNFFLNLLPICSYKVYYILRPTFWHNFAKFVLPKIRKRTSTLFIKVAFFLLFLFWKDIKGVPSLHTTGILDRMYLKFHQHGNV